MPPFAIKNLALRGIEADFGPPAGAGPNTFRFELESVLYQKTV